MDRIIDKTKEHIKATAKVMAAHGVDIDEIKNSETLHGLDLDELLNGEESKVEN